MCKKSDLVTNVSEGRLVFFRGRGGEKMEEALEFIDGGRGKEVAGSDVLAL